MVGMGYRTIKTAVGAGLAMWIASLLDLEFATFAAIIVIMCIEKTKKKTLITIKDKFFASLLSLILGALLFELLGYNPIVFSIFILFFVPILVRARIQSGFVTSMVVVLHVYTVRDANWTMFLNELYIIFIGMGIALLVNSFMPSFKRDIENFKKEIEQKFEVILFEFSAHLRDGMRSWDGKEILEVEELINESKSIAIQDVENHLLRKQNKDYYYLEMRADQLELLKQMMKIIAVFSSSSLDVEQKEMFAEFLENLSRNVHSGDTTDISLNKLEELSALIRDMELPKIREEFEVRANLFYLIFEMNNYLNIKRKLFEKKD
ncbi:aromatic acid exporter family protein [Sporosarcina sp. FA9]|uniref:aromatic acid exporter family protein n=1 Tax=Sporosarcina sp. FA9 TaxID=3413030 RepID=UPI003F657CE3